MLDRSCTSSPSLLLLHMCLTQLFLLEDNLILQLHASRKSFLMQAPPDLMLRAFLRSTLSFVLTVLFISKVQICVHTSRGLRAIGNGRRDTAEGFFPGLLSYLLVFLGLHSCVLRRTFFRAPVQGSGALSLPFSSSVQA